MLPSAPSTPVPDSRIAWSHGMGHALPSVAMPLDTKQGNLSLPLVLVRPLPLGLLAQHTCSLCPPTPACMTCAVAMPPISSSSCSPTEGACWLHFWLVKLHTTAVLLAVCRSGSTGKLTVFVAAMYSSIFIFCCPVVSPSAQLMVLRLLLCLSKASMNPEIIDKLKNSV